MAELDRTSAEKEFDNIVDDWELSFDNLDEDSAAVVDKQKQSIVSAMMRGKLVFKDGSLVMSTRDSETLTFNVPRANAYLETDNTKEHQFMKKIYNFMGAMTSKPPARLAKMDARDCKLAQAIVGLFMSG